MNKARTPEQQKIISQYFSDLGKKAAAKNKKKGSSFFKWVRSHGRQKKST